MLMTVIRIAHDSSADVWALTGCCLTVICVVTLTSCDLGHNKHGCQLTVLHKPVLSYLLQAYAIIIHTRPRTAVFTSVTNIKTCTCHTCNAG